MPYGDDALAGFLEELGDTQLLVMPGLTAPEPVRTAQTATTGTVDVNIVSRGPRCTKFAPAASTWLALCIHGPISGWELEWLKTSVVDPILLSDRC